MATSPSNAVVDRWHREIRPSLRETNLRLQDVDPSALPDDQLREHIGELLAHLHDTYELHFWLHGHDLGPIAMYLYECIEWGLDPDEAIAALEDTLDCVGPGSRFPGSADPVPHPPIPLDQFPFDGWPQVR